MKTAKTILLASALCASSPFLFAQNIVSEQYTIKGQIVDSLTNEPISFATIRIESAAESSEKPLALLACDIDGYFSVTMDEHGPYYFNMSSIGKNNALRKIELPKGTMTWDAGQLYMTDDTEMLNEVTVSAQKPLVKAEIDKLTYSLEEDPEAKVSNTLDMLRKVPMITVDGDDNIQLKGSGNFKIYLNGRPSGLLSNNPSAVLKSMPASNIKDIEVITDPGARYDAEGVSGIINIITVKRTIDGYTATASLEGSVKQTYNAGLFLSMKAGKLGLTANYNYEYENEPTADLYSFRENLNDATNHFLTQTGTLKEKERMHRGYLEGSFEIDSLNLITVDANLFRKTQREYSNMDVAMTDMNGNPVYAYNLFSENKPVFGSFEMNANYQHLTQRAGEALTLSYRFTNDPGDDEAWITVEGQGSYPNLRQWDTNRAKTNEHTAQLDYTLPIGNHTLEMGGKYILRQTDSKVNHRLFDETTNAWDEVAESFLDFTHTQNIYALYLGDAIKLGNWGIKAGIRGEGTALKVDYRNDPAQNFCSNFIDLVPNMTLSYALTESQQLRVGYNMRIRRAGIDHLNPYVDERDPLNISYGNPDLESEKSNSVNLNYTLFNSKFNMNASVSHTFVNNAIEQYVFMKPDEPNVSVTTFGNIGKRSQTGLFLYLNWMPIPSIRFFMNGGIDYVKLSSEQGGYSNEGLSGRVFGGLQFNFPKDFRLHLNAGYFMPEVQLQGKRGAFLTNGITLNKDLFNKRLTIALYCKSPFMKTWKISDRVEDQNFVMLEEERKWMRDFGITLSYRFGSLKTDLPKVIKGIVNDDVK